MRNRFLKIPLQMLIDFKEHLKYERRLADTTIDGYCFFIHEFADFVYPKDLKDIKQNDIRDFIKHLKVKEISNNSISNYLIAMRQFYNWLSYTEKSPSLDEMCFFLAKIICIKRERVNVEVPHFKEIDKLRTVLQAYKQALSYDKTSYMYRITLRDAAIFETLISTGARSFEIRKMKRCDFDLENRTVLIRQGKGGHQRVSVFSQLALETIKEHIEQSNIKADEALFVIRNGNMLNYIIKRWAKRANINPNIHAHSFRHYHVTASIRSGVPVPHVSDQVGHVNANTTRMYTHLDVDSRREEYSKINI